MQDEAHSAYAAVVEQIKLLETHHSRLREKTGRYKPNCLPYAMCVLEGLVNREKIDMLKAIKDGKTVQPS